MVFNTNRTIDCYNNVVTTVRKNLWSFTESYNIQYIKKLRNIVFIGGR